MSTTIYPDGPIEEKTFCEYVSAKNQKCTSLASKGVNGHALCPTHARYGGTMEPKKGVASAIAAAEQPIEEDTTKIEQHNATVSFVNAQAQPIDPAFTVGGLYKRLKSLESDVLQHFEQFAHASVPTAVAKALNSAALSCLKEPGVSAVHRDPDQERLPFDVKPFTQES